MEENTGKVETMNPDQEDKQVIDANQDETKETDEVPTAESVEKSNETGEKQEMKENAHISEMSLHESSQNDNERVLQTKSIRFINLIFSSHDLSVEDIVAKTQTLLRSIGVQFV